MAAETRNGHANGSRSPIQFLDLSYDIEDSEESAKALVYAIRPEWRESVHELKLTKFTDGITNTLLRLARIRPGAVQEDIDRDSILMRAYGNNTDLIIDRDREAQSHALLAAKGMAPPLLARFRNGLLYEYIPGQACSPEDLTKPPVWRGVARKLAEWHARVPISTVSYRHNRQTNGSHSQTNGSNGVSDKKTCTMNSRSPQPNLWSVLQKWVTALPRSTEKETARQTLLQHEIERTFQELDTVNGIGEDGFVFGHLDLLSGNVILLPSSPNVTPTSTDALLVTFIDYEYATPCPAAFEIANHFAEWAGFDLDYHRLPTKAVRKAFLREYLSAYSSHASLEVTESTLQKLNEDVDRWRGIPGLYWGIWALIQAKISEIDFDYAQYAEDRLDEYWAWRAESSGNRATDGKSAPLREARWAQEN